MRRYQTEITIPPDRHVRLQLPDELPEGRAIVTVLVAESSPAEADSWAEADPDRQDIEWWDEFEEPGPNPEIESISRLWPR